jgi:hypothetical protein
MMRDRRLTKEAIERRVFEALAPLIGWELVPGSIHQPHPPQPDILCQVSGLGPLAVELVAIDTSDTRLRLTNMFRTPDAWRSAMARRPQTEQEVLQADLRNAYISIHFDNDLGMRDRAALLHHLQGFLLEHPHFNGELAEEVLGTPQGFHGARIGRFEFTNGPHISAPSGSFWQPPQVEKITEKLSDKTYTPGAPLELFAYATHDEPDGAVGSLEAIQAAVAQHLPGSLFRRVHLFHVGFLKHICSISS